MTSEDFFNRVESQYKNKYPFVVYRKPNENTVFGMLQNTSDLFFTEDFSEKGFVFSPFDTLCKTVLIPYNASETISTENFASKEQTKHVVVSQLPNPINKAAHLNLIKKGIETIKTTNLEKVVLSRMEAIKLSDSNPISIFKKLLIKYSSSFVYGWYHPEVGFWLGATPETLLKIEGNRFSMMALAGTQNYNGTLNVMWHTKEQEEQQMVTNFIISNLQSTIENIKVSEVETVKAGNVLHLKTLISGTINHKPLNLKEMLINLHPTPAVCGLPKLEAKQFILKHEGYNREFYTGFLGELNFETTAAPRTGKRNLENKAYAITKKSTQLYVNLRCMQIKKKVASLYVGGGITKSSNPESEWEETVSKALVIKNVL